MENKPERPQDGADEQPWWAMPERSRKEVVMDWFITIVLVTVGLLAFTGFVSLVW